MEQGSASILIVDDSVSIVNSLGKILELNGYRVDSAFNGSDALRKIRQSEYDVVICDIEMPGITGMDFLERVRRDFDDHLDVILMTGFLDQEYFIQAIRLGASDFIRKPVESTQILRSIKSILERKRYQLDIGKFFTLLDKATVSFELNPLRFSQFGFSKVFHRFMSQNTSLSKDEISEVLICTDEMIYNAYIHGTLGLSPQERQGDQHTLQQIISERLSHIDIAAKRIRFHYVIDHQNSELTIRVEDDGEGFDHEALMEQFRRDPALSMAGHGRGLAVLYHLSDSMEFFDGGRAIQIRKRIKSSPSHS